MPLKRGSLYRFNYLWSREHRRGEISGRKSRPVCLVMQSSSIPSILFLFPITSQEPTRHSFSLAVDRHECSLGGLSFPSWIVIEEYNRLDDDELYDFESLSPIGQFSQSFMKRIAAAIKAAADAQRLIGVTRS